MDALGIFLDLVFPSRMSRRDTAVIDYGEPGQPDIGTCPMSRLTDADTVLATNLTPTEARYIARKARGESV